jgi:transcription termination factor Rho
VRGYLGGPGGGQGRRQGGGGGGKHRRDGNRGGGGGGGGGNANGNVGRHDEIYDPEPFDPSADGEIVSKAELEQARRTMSLNELKAKPINALVKVADSMGLESLARSRKQDIIFNILKHYGRNGEAVYLEILQDGFGFLRSPGLSYLAGPDDIYISPSQIRRFNLRTGDSISGLIRPPKDGERYFALLKVERDQLRFSGERRNKVLFENLTPLHPTSG